MWRPLLSVCRLQLNLQLIYITNTGFVLSVDYEIPGVSRSFKGYKCKQKKKQTTSWKFHISVLQNKCYLLSQVYLEKGFHNFLIHFFLISNSTSIKLKEFSRNCCQNWIFKEFSRVLEKFFNKNSWVFQEFQG